MIPIYRTQLTIFLIRFQYYWYDICTCQIDGIFHKIRSHSKVNNAKYGVLNFVQWLQVVTHLGHTGVTSHKTTSDFQVKLMKVYQGLAGDTPFNR